MLEAMSDLEKFINGEDRIDPLIKIALIHYQFETIHPFLDGNGRIGRLLVNQLLMDSKILSHETLYISYSLKRNRVEYYDRLTEVRNSGNFEQWVVFFLRAISESATDSIDTATKLVDLRTRNLDKINSAATSSEVSCKIFTYLESHPIIDITKTSQDLGLAYNTVSKGVQRLIDLGILAQTENVLRNRIFAYEEYLNILRKDT